MSEKNDYFMLISQFQKYFLYNHPATPTVAITIPVTFKLKYDFSYISYFNSIFFIFN